jgi:hypothetical protein
LPGKVVAFVAPQRIAATPSARQVVLLVAFDPVGHPVACAVDRRRADKPQTPEIAAQCPVHVGQDGNAALEKTVEDREVGPGFQIQIVAGAEVDRATLLAAAPADIDTAATRRARAADLARAADHHVQVEPRPPRGGNGRIGQRRDNAPHDHIRRPRQRDRRCPRGNKLAGAADMTCLARGKGTGG